MNFKRWLFNNEFNFALNEMNGAYSEIESNNMTEKLAKWIKTNHRQPLLQTPILSGSPTANRIAYDTDIEENLLANFLKNRKDAKALKINYFPSDEQILINHGLDGLFGTDKLSGLQKAIDYAKLIAAFYTNPENKRMPSTISKDKTEAALGKKLSSFREAKKGKGGTHYPEAEQAGIDAGLPNDWMDAKDFSLESRRQSAIEDAKLIAAFYKDPKNKRMPKKGSKDEIEAALGRKLNQFRQTKKGSAIRRAYHPEAEQAGIDAGLPNDWMDSKDSTPEIRKLNAIEDAKLIAAFYKDPKNKRMPSRASKDEEESTLGRKLNQFRQTKQGKGTGTHYPEAEQAGIIAGLPKNWMDTKYNIET